MQPNDHAEIPFNEYINKGEMQIVFSCVHVTVCVSIL